MIFTVSTHDDVGVLYAQKIYADLCLYYYSMYALRALLDSLAPLLGAEVELGSAVKPGWADNVPKEKIEEWTKKGLELQGELRSVVESTMEKEHWALFRKVIYTSSISQDISERTHIPLLIQGS